MVKFTLLVGGGWGGMSEATVKLTGEKQKLSPRGRNHRLSEKFYGVNFLQTCFLGETLSKQSGP